MEEANIIELARNYVVQLLSNKLPDGVCYHNVKHTKDVVRAAIEIAEQCYFTQKQLEIVTLAAWFHDCGHITTCINHEDHSKAIATDFLSRHKYPKDDIHKVLACIEATRMPQNPKTPEEQVVADADLYHFTKPDYPKYEQELRKEVKYYLNKTYSDIEWAEKNYAMLTNHSYFTPYGKGVLQKFKEVNIERIKQNLQNKQ